MPLFEAPLAEYEEIYHEYFYAHCDQIIADSIRLIDSCGDAQRNEKSRERVAQGPAVAHTVAIGYVAPTEVLSDYVHNVVPVSRSPPLR